MNIFDYNKMYKVLFFICTQNMNHLIEVSELASAVNIEFPLHFKNFSSVYSNAIFIIMCTSLTKLASLNTSI